MMDILLRTVKNKTVVEENSDSGVRAMDVADSQRSGNDEKRGVRFQKIKCI